MTKTTAAMTTDQAQGGHCTRGGSVISGAAVCQCGAWTAADAPPAERMTSRREHLALVLLMRKVAQ